MEQLNVALKKKIELGCNQEFHYLENANDELNFIHLFTGFSNTNGGEILIGIKKNGKVNGVNPKEVIDSIQELLETHKIIRATFSMNTIFIGRHLLVLIRIEKSPDNLWILEESKKVSCIRIGSSTIKVNKIIKKTWQLENSKIGVKFSDIHKSILELFVKKQALSLTYIYKNTKNQKSNIDEAVSELLYLRKICLLVSEGELSYSLTE